MAAEGAAFLFDRELKTVANVDAKRTAATGKGRDHADLDRLAGHCRQCQQRKGEACRHEVRFHFVRPPCPYLRAAALDQAGRFDCALS